MKPEKYWVHLQLRGLASRHMGLMQHSGWNKTRQLGTQYLKAEEESVYGLNPEFISSWQSFGFPVHFLEGQRIASIAEHLPPHPRPWPQVMLVRLWFLWQQVTDKVSRAFDTLSSKFSTDMRRCDGVGLLVYGWGCRDLFGWRGNNLLLLAILDGQGSFYLEQKIGFQLGIKNKLGQAKPNQTKLCIQTKPIQTWHPNIQMLVTAAFLHIEVVFLQVIFRSSASFLRSDKSQVWKKEILYKLL